MNLNSVLSSWIKALDQQQAIPDSYDHETYLAWKQHKLDVSPNYSKVQVSDLFINIDDAESPSENELQKLKRACYQNNMVLYRFNNPLQNHKQYVHQFANTLGLLQLDSNLCADEDSLTSITQKTNPDQHEYIPYSNKQLSWHTDGYYNKPENQIQGMLLHCKTPALQGGESMLMDPEIALILLFDQNPAFVKALMQPDAMTIPANILNGETIREAQTGPVFSINETGQLHMRYSARQRNIEWKQNTHTLEAVDFLKQLWQVDNPISAPHIIKYTLQAGEGVVCNNVLHCRTRFVDYDDPQKKRLLYRGRYYDRVTITKPGPD